MGIEGEVREVIDIESESKEAGFPIIRERIHRVLTVTTITIPNLNSINSKVTTTAVIIIIINNLNPNTLLIRNLIRQVNKVTLPSCKGIIQISSINSTVAVVMDINSNSKDLIRHR